MQATVSRPAARPPLVRFLLRELVVYNPLFLISATLVLGGTWLLNPPQSNGGRSLDLLLKLLPVIEVYAFALVGAAWVMARRARAERPARDWVLSRPVGLERDVRNLIFVLTPFLLDVTFTNSSLGVSVLAQSGAWAVAPVAALLLGLVAVKMRLVVALSGHRFSAAEWLALAAGPALVTLSPLVGAALALAGYADEIGLLGGLAVGGLVLLFGAVARPERVPVRALSGWALAAAVVHAGATTWTGGGSLFHVAGPTVIALGIALPRIAWPHARDLVTPFVAPIIGAGLCAFPDAQVFGVSDRLIALAALGTAHVSLFVHTRSWHFLAGGAVGLHILWGDAPAGMVLEGLGLLGLYGYALLRRAHPALVAAPLGLAAVLLQQLAPFQNGIDAILMLDLVGVGLLLWTHVTHDGAPAGARFRWAGSLLIFVPAAILGLGAEQADVAAAAQLVASLSAGSLLGVALLTRQRVYAFPCMPLLLQGSLALAPTSAAGWGVLGIVGAFGLVCLGLAVSVQRERILAWLALADARDAELGSPLVVGPRGGAG